MNSQPLNTFTQTALTEEQQQPSLLPRQTRPAGSGWRLWKAWLWLTGPRPASFDKSIAAQERLRRSRLISALLVLIVIAIPTLVPSALVQPLIWYPLVALAIGGIVVALLNRSGIVTTSGFAYIVLVDGAIAGFLYIKPIFTYGNIPNLDLFILTILIAGMILPRQLIPVVAALHICLIVAIFNLKPHDIYLQAGIAAYFHGQQYTAIVNALLLQITGAGISWLHAWSVNRAIVRASHAEELAQAHAHIDEQARQIAAQKHRLEQGIHALQAVQARVANGEYSARVSLQGNELLPLGVSFNIMAERLSRVERIEQDHHRLEQAVQQAVEVCERLGRGIAPGALRATGTPVDRIVPFLARVQHLLGQLVQGSALAEDLRAVMQHQHDYLSELENQLFTSLSLAKDLAIETAQVPSRPPEERISGGLSMYIARAGGPPGAQEQEESRRAALEHIKNVFDKHIALLEQARKYCTQASDLGRRCTMGARLLSQQLKEAS
ncbi:MAG TPA: hypothetical protein VH599_16190 [Ktedonobacterales bacterium]|jgi:hypothetical protein